jgi:hypothetical protein
MDTLIAYNYDNNTHHKIKTDSSGNLYTVSAVNTTVSNESLSINQDTTTATIDLPHYSNIINCSSSSNGCIVIEDTNINSGNTYIVQISFDNVTWHDKENIYLFNSTSTTRSGSLDINLKSIMYLRLRYNSSAIVSSNIFLN